MENPWRTKEKTRRQNHWKVRLVVNAFGASYFSLTQKQGNKSIKHVLTLEEKNGFGSSSDPDPEYTY